MAAYNKYNKFVLDLINGVHDFDAHTFKVMLTLTAPDAADEVKADLTEIAAGNGYTAGGSTSTITTSVAGGTAKVTGTDVVFTASGSMASFRYATLYNDTPASPADPLISFFDYGAAVNLLVGETFTVDFDASSGIFTLT